MRLHEDSFLEISEKMELKELFDFAAEDQDIKIEKDINRLIESVFFVQGRRGSVEIQNGITELLELSYKHEGIFSKCLNSKLRWEKRALPKACYKSKGFDELMRRFFYLSCQNEEFKADPAPLSIGGNVIETFLKENNSNLDSTFISTYVPNLAEAKKAIIYFWTYFYFCFSEEEELSFLQICNLSELSNIANSCAESAAIYMVAKNNKDFPEKFFRGAEKIEFVSNNFHLFFFSPSLLEKIAEKNGTLKEQLEKEKSRLALGNDGFYRYSANGEEFFEAVLKELNEDSYADFPYWKNYEFKEALKIHLQVSKGEEIESLNCLCSKIFINLPREHCLEFNQEFVKETDVFSVLKNILIYRYAENSLTKEERFFFLLKHKKAISKITPFFITEQSFDLDKEAIFKGIDAKMGRSKSSYLLLAIKTSLLYVYLESYLFKIVEKPIVGIIDENYERVSFTPYFYLFALWGIIDGEGVRLKRKGREIGHKSQVCFAPKLLKLGKNPLFIFNMIYSFARILENGYYVVNKEEVKVYFLDYIEILFEQLKKYPLKSNTDFSRKKLSVILEMASRVLAADLEKRVKVSKTNLSVSPLLKKLQHYKALEDVYDKKMAIELYLQERTPERKIVEDYFKTHYTNLRKKDD